MSQVFQRIITVMFENQYRSYVQQNAFMEKLALAGASMGNFFGCFHPSQTNYVAALAGEVCNITNDTPPAQPLPQANLVDLLETQGISWKAYMEGYPEQAWNPAWATGSYPEADAPLNEYPNNGVDLARYFRKHNAFASFESIQSDQLRWSRIVSDTVFWSDVAAGQLPQYSWFTPDIWNDGHYLYNTHSDTNPRTQLIPQIATYLEHLFLGDMPTKSLQGYTQSSQTSVGLNLDIDLLITDPARAWQQSNVPPGTLIVITFDEADFNASNYDTMYDGPNQIYTVLLGDMISPGSQIDTPYNHYSLIRTVQKNFNLPSLNKNDRAANWLRDLWGETWHWTTPEDTPVGHATALCATSTEKGSLIVYRDDTGAVHSREKTAEHWQAAHAICPVTAAGQLALATLGDNCYLVSHNAEHQLCCNTYQQGRGWSDAMALGIENASAFAMAAYSDVGDADINKLMLCWQSDSGSIQSKIFDGTTWGDDVPVGQYTDGEMALAQFGGSLFLVYKQRNTRRIAITSFNLAPFNTITAKNFEGQAAPDNDTSHYQWSPAEYLVGHFSGKQSTVQDLYQTTGQMALTPSEGLLHLVFRDTYSDQSQVYHSCFGLTGINTASSQWTNGYGTLSQAGWTRPITLDGTEVAQHQPLAMSSNGHTITLWWQNSQGSITCREGYYAPDTN